MPVAAHDAFQATAISIRRAMAAKHSASDGRRLGEHAMESHDSPRVSDEEEPAVLSPASALSRLFVNRALMLLCLQRSPSPTST